MGSFERLPHLATPSFLKSGNISNSNLHIFLIIHFLLPSYPALFFCCETSSELRTATWNCITLKIPRMFGMLMMTKSGVGRGGPFLSECLRLELSLSLRCRPHYQSVVFWKRGKIRKKQHKKNVELFFCPQVGHKLGCCCCCKMQNRFALFLSWVPRWKN